MKRKVATIKEIAKKANVSAMTVSRALNDSAYVRTETRKKILRIARELDYRPNRMARSLVSSRSHLLGLIVSNIRNQFFAELARGIEDKAHSWGYNIVFSSTDNKPEHLERAIRMMLEIGVDGLIVTCSRLVEPRVSSLIDQSFPIVLVSRRLREGNANFVVMDNEAGAHLATNHLIDCGYQRIAIISGPGNWSAGIERLEGYRNSLLERGLPVDASLIKKGPFTKEFGLHAATQLFQLDDPPDAIFATNDDIALGVMTAADACNMKIPDSLGLIGFDDTEISAHPNIALTTIKQKKYEMGELAMQMLRDLIERENAQYRNQIVLEPELVIRRSCGYQLKRPTSDDAVR